MERRQHQPTGNCEQNQPQQSGQPPQGPQNAQQQQQAQQEFELEKQAREFEHEVLIAQIESFKFQQDQDSNDNGVPDPLEIMKLRQEAGFKDRKLKLEEKKLEFDKEKSAKELAIKRSKPSGK